MTTLQLGRARGSKGGGARAPAPAAASAYAWGENASGELSLARHQRGDALTPREVRVPGGEDVADVAFGLSHCVALAARSGQAATCGSWLSGRLGHADVRGNLARLRRLPLPGRVAGVAAGDHHTVAVLEDGQMLAWGGASGGKTGHDGDGVMVVMGGVRQADCGRVHTVACTEDGEAVEMGGGSAVPRLVPGLADVFVRRVACGGGHTLALASDGSVWAWGAGEFGQLGHGDATDREQPEAVAALAPGSHNKENGAAVGAAVGIACGEKHSAVVTSCGRVYTFGCGANGQLGHGRPANERAPRLVQALEGLAAAAATGSAHASAARALGKRAPGRARVVQVAAGLRHTLALAGDGTVFAWGDNGRGQLGTGDTQTRTAPVAVPALAGVRVAQIAAGGSHSFASARSFEGAAEVARVSGRVEETRSPAPSRRVEAAGRAMAVTHTPSPPKARAAAASAAPACTPIRALAWDDPTPFSSPVVARTRRRESGSAASAASPAVSFRSACALGDSPLYSPVPAAHHTVSTDLSAAMTQTLDASPPRPRPARTPVPRRAAVEPRAPGVEVLASPQVRMIHRYATFYTLQPDEARLALESCTEQLAALDCDDALSFCSVTAAKDAPPSAPAADGLVPRPAHVTVLLVYTGTGEDAAGSPAPGGGRLPVWASILASGAASFSVCEPSFRELRPLR